MEKDQREQIIQGLKDASTWSFREPCDKAIEYLQNHSSSDDVPSDQLRAQIEALTQAEAALSALLGSAPISLAQMDQCDAALNLVRFALSHPTKKQQP